MLILWILFWAIGWVILYMIMARHKDFHRIWDNEDRIIASLLACFSWFGILVCVAQFLLNISFMLLSKGARKVSIVKCLKKLEPKSSEKKM